MNNKRKFIELLKLQKELLKNNEIEKLKTINKQIFMIRENSQKRREKENEKRKEAQLNLKIEKLCIREL